MPLKKKVLMQEGKQVLQLSSPVTGAGLVETWEAVENNAAEARRGVQTRDGQQSPGDPLRWRGPVDTWVFRWPKTLSLCSRGQRALLLPILCMQPEVLKLPRGETEKRGCGQDRARSRGEETRMNFFFLLLLQSAHCRRCYG